VQLEHHIIRRLAFVKYLYQTAIAQSTSAPPLNSASILTMHDSVELFLQLSCEVLNVSGKRIQFLEYWALLNEKLEFNPLAQEAAMRRLNSTRVALKHHGTLSSEIDIEAHRASTTSFFALNTPIIFELEFDEISLVEFVNPERSRHKLQEAIALKEGGHTLDSIDHIALAFEWMIRDYSERKSNFWYNSPFSFGKDMSLGGSFSSTFGFDDRDDRRLAEFVENAQEAISSLQSAVRILSLGLDYRKYSRFKQLTPSIAFALGGNHFIHRAHNIKNDDYSVEDIQFCLDFVIESSIKLSEFDYTIPRPEY